MCGLVVGTRHVGWWVGVGGWDWVCGLVGGTGCVGWWVGLGVKSEPCELLFLVESYHVSVTYYWAV